MFFVFEECPIYIDFKVGLLLNAHRLVENNTIKLNGWLFSEETMMMIRFFFDIHSNNRVLLRSVTDIR
jgi:hypothetical protein